MGPTSSSLFPGCPCFLSTQGSGPSVNRAETLLPAPFVLSLGQSGTPVGAQRRNKCSVSLNLRALPPTLPSAAQDFLVQEWPGLEQRCPLPHVQQAGSVDSGDQKALPLRWGRLRLQGHQLGRGGPVRVPPGGAR